MAGVERGDLGEKLGVDTVLDGVTRCRAAEGEEEEDEEEGEIVIV